MAKKENKRKAPTKGKGIREEKRRKKKAADKDKRKRKRDEDEKPKAKAESGDDGPGSTMFRVSTNDKHRNVCGWYSSGKSAARATDCTSDSQVNSALRRSVTSKKDKGVVGRKDQFIVEKIENCTESEGPTEFGQQDGKWKMKEHARGSGRGSNNSRVGADLGLYLNSSNEKIPEDEHGRTFGDVIKGVENKNGVQRDGFVVYDGDMFAKLMAWEKGRISSKLGRLRRNGSNKKSRRLDNGKRGSFPQFWYVDGLRTGLDDYTVFSMVA